MKMEYHKKIQQLDLEVRQLERERSENLKKAENVQQKNKVEEGYKKRMKDLDDKLKDLKKERPGTDWHDERSDSVETKDQDSRR